MKNKSQLISTSSRFKWHLIENLVNEFVFNAINVSTCNGISVCLHSENEIYSRLAVTCVESAFRGGLDDDHQFI